MKFYSTSPNAPAVDLKDAVRGGLAPDGGLYMPEEIPRLEKSFFERLPRLSFTEIALEVLSRFDLGLPREAVEAIVGDAFDFPVPVRELDPGVSVLELFHGPTLAFKDFGARFMARLLARLDGGASAQSTVLVATSGDTGSAVAQGFFGLPGFRVVILFPSGGVSEIQEKQLTTMGGNVQALEVRGSFDDCQRMVKSAFADADLTAGTRLISANSINIARLLPQSLYYFSAARNFLANGGAPVFAVPSGNFGNLTAGLLAARMGLPVRHFVAATNVNDVVPQYLAGAEFAPRPSRPTISNAMDVGNPSNFVRMLALYGGERAKMSAEIFGAAFDDEQTRAAIRDIFDRYGYIADPHTAVGFLGLRKYQAQAPGQAGVVLSTAHPGKFYDTVRAAIGREFALPPTLAAILKKEGHSVELSNEYGALREYLTAAR